MERRTTNEKPKAGHNGFDTDVLKSIVGRIENLKEEILSVRGKAMQECKSLSDDIKEVYEEGKSRGIPTKELKKAVKARELTLKIEALREDLDDLVERDTYDQIRFALGDLADTPLGAAASAGAPGAPEEDNGDPEVEAGAANGEKVKKGIKALKGADAAGTYSKAH